MGRGIGKGECTQNVMAACDFDVQFTFINVGWESTTNDSWIVVDAMYNPKWNYPHASLGECFIALFIYVTYDIF